MPPADSSEWRESPEWFGGSKYFSYLIEFGDNTKIYMNTFPLTYPDSNQTNPRLSQPLGITGPDGNAESVQKALIHDPESNTHPVRLLLSILREKQPGSELEPKDPLKSVVKEESVQLMYRILSESEDHDTTGSIVDRLLINELDVKDFLDIILCLTCSRYMRSSDNKRARQLMFKVLKKTTVIPGSLFVTGARIIQPDCDYISAPEFRLPSVPKLRGNIKFALRKISYETRKRIKFCHTALTWRTLSHEYVLPFLGIYEDELKSQRFLVLPCMKNGTLAQWRKKLDRSAAEIQERMLEVAKGLKYIHSEGVVHGSLRGDNVLLDDNLHVQIDDFGLSEISEATASTHSQALGYNFAAPELFTRLSAVSGVPDLDDSVTKMQKSDIYAFGCLYYQIHYDVIPFANMNSDRIAKLVSGGKRPPRRSDPPMEDNTWRLIDWCWEMRAMDRPSTDDIINCIQSGTALRKRQRIVLFKKIRRIAICGIVILAMMVLVSYHIGSILNALSQISSPEVTETTEAGCGTSFGDWRIRTFRPKWFGLFGEPAPIIYRTPITGNKAYRISIVDIDKRDIEIRMWFDDLDLGYKRVNLDWNVDCGDDKDKCLQQGFASSEVVVPPGRHTIKAEIVKHGNKPFHWGSESWRNVMWAVHQCNTEVTQSEVYE